MHKKLLIIISSIFFLTLVFYFSADKILFIHDPYTIAASGSEINKIKLHGLINGKIIRFAYFNPGEKNFDKTVKKILLFKGEKTVITAYLFLNIARENAEISSFLQEKHLFIFGPLFDFSSSSVNISGNIESFFYDTGLYLASENNFNRVEFFFQDSMIDKNPEKIMADSIIKGIRDIYPDTVISKSGTDFSDSAVLTLLTGSGFQSDTPIVLFNRYLSEKIIDLFRNSGRPVIGFLYIEEKNLNSRLDLPESTILAEFDYSGVMKKVFRSRLEKGTGSVNYTPVFKSNRFKQKK